jgi:hypothetical protein
MIRQSITYTNFDDEEVTEEHYFHLSKLELIDLELAEEGGMSAKLQAITESGDPKQILDTFKFIISKSYGHRETGSKFVKSDEISNEFLTSPAFDQFYGQLLTDPGLAAEFINGVVPKDLASEPDVVKAIVAAGLPDPHGLDKQGAWPGRPIVKNASIDVGPTEAEQDKMTGLKEPRIKNGKLVAWAYRHPTDNELTAMTRAQLLDAMRRKSTDWEPPV